MKLPCDMCVWGLIPMIKRELVLRLFKKYGLSKVIIAGKLGITKGSVTQYIQGKRASNSGRIRKMAKASTLIDKLAKGIASNKISQKDIAKRFCVICKLAQKSMGVC